MELSALQEVIRATYGTRDRARGVDATFGWFIEEVGELSRAIRREGHPERVVEFTDVLAWLVSLADLCEVDLDTEFAARYGGGCPKCHAVPCVCDPGVSKGVSTAGVSAPRPPAPRAAPCSGPRP